MRLIKVTGGLGNQMFIYAFYLRMKKYYPKVRIDLSDMMHYKVHYGYEMHRVFNLPHTEFCINQPLKKYSKMERQLFCSFPLLRFDSKVTGIHFR